MISTLVWAIESASGYKSLLALTLLHVGIAAWIFSRWTQPFPKIPVYGLEGGVKKARERFICNSAAVIDDAIKRSGQSVCQIFTDNEFIVLLPPWAMDEVRSDKNFNFEEIVKRDFMGDWPAFGQMHTLFSHGVFQETIRVKLTRAIPKLMEPLSNEARIMLTELFPPTKEWTVTEKPMWDMALVLVSHLSARAFLGEPLCHNREWLDLSITYAHEMINAVLSLRRWPRLLRPIVYYTGLLCPEIKIMQQRQRQVYAFIEPELRRRRALWGTWEKNAVRSKANGEHNKPLDTLWWLDEVAAEKGQPIDVVMGQLAINLAAVHTSSSLLVNVMFDLAARPELAQELRLEIARNIGSGEFCFSEVDKKDHLRGLRLMDSVLKETQRFHAPNVIVMKRATVGPTTLTDGTRIPAGATVGVPVSWMAHPSICERGDEYDGHRYLQLQEDEPNDSSRWNFVTTSSAHWGFGHGTHACPGRFFASVELKIVLVHLLMGYEWRLEGGKTGAENMPKTSLLVDQMMPDNTARLEFRCRVP